MRRCLASACLLLVLAALSSAARARSATEGESGPEPARAPLRWYGWQIAAVKEVEPAAPPPTAPVVLVGSSSATVGLAGSF